MKKVISLVMAIALVMCLAIPTFAAQPDTVVPQHAVTLGELLLRLHHGLSTTTRNAKKPLW